MSVRLFELREALKVFRIGKHTNHSLERLCEPKTEMQEVAHLARLNQLNLQLRDVPREKIFLLSEFARSSVKFPLWTILMKFG